MKDYQKDEFGAVEIVDKIIHQAIKMSASDIHLESMRDFLRVRFRLDGILYDQPNINFDLAFQVISRIKILANIDIALKRVPQDGKIHINLKDGNVIDLRVSTFPSVYGEKIVIRILDRLKQKIELDNLGFENKMLCDFANLINKASGFLLVTGPTGSGKTTTLYAAISKIHSPEKNIITLEDPVEYNISGVTQGQINVGSGFTFAKGIRSLLRQDPDIAMIGEIRDKESAKIAIEAALTGHLVFSTLHTSNAPGAIMRLMDMSIEPFLINASVTGVLAQRLVRKICSNCKEIVKQTDLEQKALKELKIEVKNLFRGQGCGECNNIGYKGRVGIFELLVMSEDLRALIVEQPKFEDIKRQALKDGMKTLFQDAVDKLKIGVTTLEEIIKII